MNNKRDVHVSLGSGRGCVLWIVAGALIFIGLTLAGFSASSAATYAAGAVAGIATLATMLPCGIICCFLALGGFVVLAAAMLDGARRDLHVSSKTRRW